MPIYHIPRYCTSYCTYEAGPGIFFDNTVSAMGLKINDIYNEDLLLLGSHVSQTVFHVAFFESVLTWGHITTSTCRSLIRWALSERFVSSAGRAEYSPIRLPCSVTPFSGDDTLQSSMVYILNINTLKQYNEVR
jgi:hypothetical protein